MVQQLWKMYIMFTYNYIVEIPHDSAVLILDIQLKIVKPDLIVGSYVHGSFIHK